MASQAAVVKAAKMDDAKANILIEVTYAGGCGRHDFSLQVGGCLESLPVQCTVELIHKTDDMCEAFVRETIAISLAESGLTDRYFERAFLTIVGDKAWNTDKRSSANVRLP